MNVNDVPSPPVCPVKEMTTHIFTRQSALEEFYWKIENRPSKVISPENREGQVILKDFLWRITEEVGEALEALLDKDPRPKISEELADGFHFVTGMFVILGREDLFRDGFVIPPTSVATTGGSLITLVMTMGQIGNCLKLKPWKQTDVTTDLSYFYRLLPRLVMDYIDLCNTLGLNINSLYDYYWRKSEVNLFRIRSNY